MSFSVLGVRLRRRWNILFLAAAVVAELAAAAAVAVAVNMQQEPILQKQACR